MNKTIFLLVSLIFFGVTCTSNTVYGASQDVLVIEYAKYKGNPVELVYDQNDGSVQLRIRYSGNYNSVTNDDLALNFLREEALRLSSSRVIPLGKSGYNFRFLGGHPIWGPYMSIQLDYHYRCLQFAGSGSVTGKTILARGTKIIEGYNGYALWKPDIPKKQ